MPPRKPAPDVLGQVLEDVQKSGLVAPKKAKPKETTALPGSYTFGTTKEERKATIEKVLSNADDQVRRLRDSGLLTRPKVIPTGSIKLDLALGVGGWPWHRVVEIYGAESSGKTTLVLQAIAEAQRMGGTCAFIDAEHALDVAYAEALGVNTEDVLISQPDNGEQGLQIASDLIDDGVNLIVIDSVAALVPKAELEGKMGDVLPGLQARMMSQALRKLTGRVAKSNCVVMFTNQTREKIGTTGYGPKKTTTGGNALKFYASIRVEVARIGDVQEGGEKVGNRTKITVRKNKVAPPFKEIEVDLIWGKGISREYEAIELGVEAGVLKKSGSWYSLGDERIAQGRFLAVQVLAQRPDVIENIRRAALEQGIGVKKSTPGEDNAKD